MLGILTHLKMCNIIFRKQSFVRGGMFMYKKYDFKLEVSDRKGVELSRGMYGLFFEDINYAADGGIYAEFIENRSFGAVKYIGGGRTEFDGLYAWSEYPKDGGRLEISEELPLSKNNPHYLRFTSHGKDCGFSNSAYDGIYAENGDAFNFSFYAKTTEGYTGDITISLCKDGKTYAASRAVPSESGNASDWQKYSAELIAGESVEKAKVVITLSECGTVCFDMVSMFPKSAVLGLFRRDLAEKLKALSPGFLRFPGGCVVEGYNISNRYNWKDTVGDQKDRKHNWSRWSAHTDLGLDDGYKHYNQSLGLGFYEYFILCEYLGAKPVPVVSCGLGCQYQGKDALDTDSAAMRELIQDALDLIEFANGDISTKWGGVRADMGHPLPFGLEFIGIGNEQWETEDNDFYGKYEKFENAIHKAYPEIKLVGTAGSKVNNDTYNSAWNWLREKYQQNPKFVSVVDEHYYMTPEWFFENDDFYDNYSRDIKVFAGEYAARHEGENKPNYPQANRLGSAIAAAAFMTGLERNADVVKMAAYAPLFARVNYTQWSPDLIWFDGKTSYVTPDYYTQYMYSNNLGSYTLMSELTGSGKLYHTEAFDTQNGDVIIKLINGEAEAKKICIDVSRFKVHGTANVTLLCGDDLNTYNDIDNSDRIKLEVFETEAGNEFDYTLPKYSFAVIRINANRTCTI